MKYLVELLEKEIDIYNEYLEIAAKKKQALMDNNIDTIDEITGMEKTLSTKVLALEAARMEFLREKGYKSSTTLDELLPELESNDQAELRDVAGNLRQVIANCKKFNDQNLTLLKQSSSYINHMIKVFSNTFNQKKPATYAKGVQRFQSGRIADMQG